MEFSLEQIKKYRTRFGWVFLVSFSLPSVWTWIDLIDLIFFGPRRRVYTLPDPSRAPELGPQLAYLILVVSLLTSIISLLGFVITTFFAWRKERREREHSDLDLEKKRLEVERLRQELVRGRRQDSQDG